MNLTLKVCSREGAVIAEASGHDEAVLFYEPEYTEGDTLTVECDEPERYLVLQLDDSVAPAFVFLKSGACSFPVPYGEQRLCCSPRAYLGEKHLLHVRRARAEEIACRRNLALNPYDFHGNDSLYPHAGANVETRGEAVFAARNAMDGLKACSSHGKWPFTSWGINRDPQAALKMEFGRRVELDEAVFYLRADFPHDAWWEKVTLAFSDGSSVECSLKKTGEAQSVSFPKRKVEWVVLKDLIKADDPSPFPALTQIEYYGKNL